MKKILSIITIFITITIYLLINYMTTTIPINPENISTTLFVKPCDLNGNRKPNAVVDIGFDDDYVNRDYYAYTNEYGQLIKVEAKEIIIQNDNKEPIKSNGRFCEDEAKVKGTEQKTLDEGHAIADSLGGVSNAYNITSQDSYLNRQGTQADMEQYIRDAEKDAHKIENFEYLINYDNTTTQIPSSYEVTFLDNGKKINYKYNNKN